MTTTVVAFIEHDTGFKPGHVKEIKKGNVYYLVIDGQRGQIHEAVSDAIEDDRADCGWRVEGHVYE